MNVEFGPPCEICLPADMANAPVSPFDDGVQAVYADESGAGCEYPVIAMGGPKYERVVTSFAGVDLWLAVPKEGLERRRAWL